MKKVGALGTIAALMMLSGVAQATPVQALTVEEVTDFKVAWGEGIVKIGEVYKAGGDYRQAAREHIERFYAYGEEPVLFKPTLASADQFRGSFNEALSYFVGGDISEDGGFAITPYTAVRWENSSMTIDDKTGLAMGNYYFTKTDKTEVKVEYSFAIRRMNDGELKIVLHHSSLPYTPAE